MDEQAEETADVLREQVGEEPLHGVAYYDDGNIGFTYLSDFVQEQYDREEVEEIIRDLQLETVGHAAHEIRHKQNVRATVRVYDDLLDVLVPQRDEAGIVYALDADGDYSTRESIEAVERAIESTDQK